jgi:D-alanyl-D-alanine carboxypeptidase
MKSAISYFLLIVWSTVYSQKIDNQKIDDYINHIENNNRGIGSVSIFNNGREVYNRSFGQGKLENVKYDANAKYQVGSITKIVTATLIFKLIENNKLKLEDKLSNFYPEIPNSENITIKNLLEHSSGLGDFSVKNDSIQWLTTRVSEKDIFDEIIKQGIDFQPNEKVEYSNSGYYILTKIVEKKYKSNYAAIVKNKIVKPLKLNNFSSSKNNSKNVFKSYSFEGAWNEITEYDFSNVLGVGDIASTTRDLNIFITKLFQYKILKKESVEIMKPIYNKELFGRGLMVIPFYEILFYGHGGDTFGTHSILGYNEKDKISFAISINGQRFPHNDFAIGLLSIIYEQEYEYPIFKDAIELKAEDLDIYFGVYSSRSYKYKLRIFKEGTVLKVKGPGEPAFPLECYEVHKFNYDHHSMKFEFKPLENKMILNLSGREIIMTKE